MYKPLIFYTRIKIIIALKSSNSSRTKTYNNSIQYLGISSGVGFPSLVDCASLLFRAGPEGGGINSLSTDRLANYTHEIRTTLSIQKNKTNI